MLAAARHGQGPTGGAPKRSYVGNFSRTESPISDNGMLRSGATAGRDWSDIITAGGLAYGTQANGQATPPYNDSLCCVNGVWAANQQAEAVCHFESGNVGAGYHELELLLRWDISTGIARGYEVNHAHDGGYAEIVLWNGALNGYTLPQNEGTPRGPLVNGGKFRAAAIGFTITAWYDYLDGLGFQQVATCDIRQFNSGAPPNIWTDGAPGFGHWNHGTTNTVTALAYSSFSAVEL